jgi:hypothetical protein
MSNQPNAGDAAAVLSEAAVAVKQAIVPAVQDALLEMPEEQAFALEMSLFEGEDDAAIASMLETSEEEVRGLRKEAREELLETELGQKLDRSSLQNALDLAGRYWRQRRERDAERYKEAFEEAYESLETQALSEQLSESLGRLWQQVVDEFDATAEQVVGAGTAAIQGFGSARALAAPEEGGKERAEFSFEMPEEDLYGTLIREMGDQWRIVFEVHRTGLEGTRVAYEIATTTGNVFHEGTVELKEFGEGIFEGGEAIGALEIPSGAEPQVRVVEWKDN